VGSAVGLGSAVEGACVGDGRWVRVGVGFGVYDGSGAWSGSAFFASTYAGSGKSSTSMPSMARSMIAVHVWAG
jgi:hypothetical protein